MRTWKILLIAGLAVLAIGLVAASAFAAAVRPIATPYGTSNGVSGPYGGYAGNCGGVMQGGMMGSYGYSSNSGYATGSNGHGRCIGWGW